MAEKRSKAESTYSIAKKSLESGRHFQAMLQFTEAIKRDDKHCDSYLGRADAFLHLDYHHLAREDAEKYITLRPNQVEGFIKKGEIELAAESFNEARVTFEKGLTIDIKNVDLLLGLNRTNRGQRVNSIYEKRIQMQGFGVGTFFGVLFILANEFLVQKEVIEGVVMKTICFGACCYLGYLAAKFYTDVLEQQRRVLLEPPKVSSSDPFAGLGNMPSTTTGQNSPSTSKNSSERKKDR